MKRIAIIIIALWALLAGGVWAAEKDCFEAAKIEVGGRYLALLLKKPANSQFYVVVDGREGLKEIIIQELSPSRKYALVKTRNEEKAYWEEIKNIEVIEKLPLAQGTLFLER